MDSHAPKYPLHTLSNALEVLQLISESPTSDGMTLTAISEALQLNKSTVHRILDTLLAYQFVEKAPNVIKTYRLSWGAYKIGNSVPQSHSLSSSNYMDVMKTLYQQLGRSCILHTNSEYSSIISYKIDDNKQLSSFSIVGTRLPMYATASGKLFLLNFSKDDIKRYFQHTEIKRFTSSTILNYIDFLDELQTIQQKGYSLEQSEYEASSCFMAMPIYDYTNKIVATISIKYAPEEATETLYAEILPYLGEACSILSTYLGYQAF